MVKKKVRLHVYLKQNDKNTDRVWQTVGLYVFFWLLSFFRQNHAVHHRTNLLGQSI